MSGGQRTIIALLVLALLGVGGYALAGPALTGERLIVANRYAVSIGGSAAPAAGVDAGAPAAAGVVPSGEYRYDAPPSVSRATYIAGWCHPPMPGWSPSPACDEAGAMYDVLVAAGLDPAVEFGQAAHETVLGTAGTGVPSIKNLHGVQCHSGDNRIGNSAVRWGNKCAGIYSSYTAAVETWAQVILREYVAEGLNTPDSAVWKYAPPGADGNNPSGYIAEMKGYIDALRATEPAPAAAASDVRSQLVAYALSLQGTGYSQEWSGALGFRPDCSGTMNFIYRQVTGRDIGSTTYDQFPGLTPIDLSQALPGDLWYGQYSNDQHTGMLADVDGDGRWDLIHNGGDSHEMHVSYDFLNIPYFRDYTMGFRRAL